MARYSHLVLTASLVAACTSSTEPRRDPIPNVLTATQITRIEGDNQRAASATTLSATLRVRVTDYSGTPVRDEAVTFTVVSGGGTIQDASAVTDEMGIAASGPWTLGSARGVQQVSARIDRAETVFSAILCDEACSNLRLVFSDDRQIRETNLAGDYSLSLHDGLNGLDAEPAWSPDGQRIVFVGSERQVPGLYVMNADGSNVVRRSDGGHSPSWSPDGRHLAVDSGSCVYTCDLYTLIVENDGTAAVQIHNMGADPAWSPDGSKIAFVSLSGDDGYHALHLMNADGTEIEELTVRDISAINKPTWSPDGKRIAFSKCTGNGCNIFVVNADGSDLVQLTTVSDANASPIEPAWSPDGLWIAFTSGRYGIAVVGANTGGNPISVSLTGRSPAWRPLPR